MVDIIDEAAVRITAEIDPAFSAKVRKAVEKSLKGVDKQVRASLKPISKAIEDGIVDPFDRAAARVRASARAAGRGISDGIEDGAERAARQIDELAARAEADLANLNGQISVDTARASAQVDALVAKTRAEIERIDGDISLDPAKAQAQINRLITNSQKRLASLNADVEVRTATAQARVDSLVAKSNAKLDRISSKVDIDTSGALAQIEALAASVRGSSDIALNVDAQTAAARAQIESFIAANSGREIDIKVGGSGGLSAIAKALDGIGSSAGRATGLMRPLIVAIAAAAVAATPLVGATALAAGSLISAAAAASSLALAFTTVKVASSGVSEALEAQSKAQQELARTGEISEATQQQLDAAMRNLAPSARALVKEIKEIGPAWSKARRDTQQALFEGTAPLLQRISEAYLPTIRRVLVGVAGDFNKMAGAAVDSVTKASTVRRVGEVLQSMRVQLQSIIPAIGNIAVALGTLFAGSQGEAQTLSEGFLRASETFRDFATRVTESGKFQQFLSDATTAARALFDAVGAVGGVIKTVLAASAQVGVEAFGAITDSFNALNDQLSSGSGQAALEGFFSGVSAITGTLVDTIANLGPFFAGLGDVFSALQGPMVEVRAALEPLTAALSQSLGNTLTSLAGPLAALVDGFAGFLRVITPLAPAFGPLVVGIVAYNVATRVAAATTAAWSAVVTAAGVVTKAYNVVLNILNGTYIRNIAFAIRYHATLIAQRVAQAAATVATTAYNIALNLVNGTYLRAIASTVASTAALVANRVATIAASVAARASAIGMAVFTAAQWALNAALSANPIGLVVVAIGALVAGLIVAYKRSETFRKIVDKIGSVLKKGLTKAIEGAVAAFDFLRDNFDKVKVALLVLLGPIGLIILAFKNWDKIKEVVGRVATAVSDFTTKVVKWLTDLIAKISKFVVDAVKFFAGLPAKIGAALASLAATLGRVIGSALQKATQQVVSWIAAYVRFYASLPGKIVNALSGLGGKLVGVFQKALTSVRTTVTNGIANIVSAFTSLPGKILGVATKVFNAAKGLGSKIISGITAGLKATGGFISGLKDAIVGAINSVLRLPLDIRLPDIKGVPGLDGQSFTLIPRFARGGIVDKAVLGLLGEAGREVVLPLTPKFSARTLDLLKRSGLLDRPSVQSAVAERMPRIESPVERIFTQKSTNTTTVVAPVKQTVNNYTQSFNLLPNGDPFVHAQQVAARIAASAGR